MGLYNADIAGLLGGIGGGIPLIPIDVEVDDEALAYILKDMLLILLLLHDMISIIIITGKTFYHYNT